MLIHIAIMQYYDWDKVYYYFRQFDEFHDFYRKAYRGIVVVSADESWLRSKLPALNDRQYHQPSDHRYVELISDLINIGFDLTLPLNLTEDEWEETNDRWLDSNEYDALFREIAQSEAKARVTDLQQLEDERWDNEHFEAKNDFVDEYYTALMLRLTYPEEEVISAFRQWYAPQDAPKPQFYDTLVPEGVVPQVVAVGTTFTLEAFKALGPFRIERKLIYDDFEYRDDEGKETTEVGCIPYPNVAYPVLTKTSLDEASAVDETFNQIYCVSDILGWVNTGANTDPNTRRVIKQIRVMNEQDIEERELRAFAKERARLQAKRAQLTDQREIQQIDYQLRELERKVVEQKAEKVRRSGLKRLKF